MMLALVPVALFLIRPAGVSFEVKTAAAGCFALVVTGLVCLGIYIFGPHFLFGHGHGYFAERMSVPFVICCLARVGAPALTGRAANNRRGFCGGYFPVYDIRAGTANGGYGG